MHQPGAERSPAVAASHAGDLRIKGPANTAYTQGPFVSQVGNEGSTLTWTIAVVNVGQTLAQFRINVLDNDPSAPLHLYEGTLLLQPLASGPDGYYTRALAPGASQALTAKMTIPFNNFTHNYSSNVGLFGVDGVFLEQIQVLGHQTAPVGSSPYDVAIKSGRQKPVGNGQSGQFMTAGTITPTGTATFTATLRNSTSTTPVAIGFSISSPFTCPNFAVTVKRGFTNVTAAVLAGTYQTAPLARGGTVTLTITMKAAGTTCSWSAWQGITRNGNTLFNEVGMIVNLTA